MAQFALQLVQQLTNFSNRQITRDTSGTNQGVCALGSSEEGLGDTSYAKFSSNGSNAKQGWSDAGNGTNQKGNVRKCKGYS
jgi:hypothetical protein